MLSCCFLFVSSDFIFAL
jgi:protein-L-isoaspartate(D-aspartate) O-methyltransferase